MDKIITVGVREFIETVKTKTFFITSVLLPLVMLGMIFGSQSIAEWAEKETMPAKHFAVRDESGAVYDDLSAQIDQYNEEKPTQPYAFELSDAPVEELSKRVMDGDLYAYIVIPANVLAPANPTLTAEAGDEPIEDAGPGMSTLPAGAASCELGRKDGNPEVSERLKAMLNTAIVRVRFATADPPVDYERVSMLQKYVGLRQVDVTSGEDTGSDIVRFMAPFAFMFLLFMGTMTISQGLLTSVIEEKSSRVVEVLLSAVSPTQLMAGKILGTVCVGALLMVVWGSVGYVSAQSRDLGYLVTGRHLIYAGLYFVPGFLLIAAFLAAAGAACNTIKEAQSMAAPLTILSIVPMMLWWLIMLNPNSILSVVLSYIPPITPFVMILRVCADPEISLFQVVTTLALMWASVLAMIWAAGKIFRVGVLMYGKPPSLKELIRWVRYD